MDRRLKHIIWSGEDCASDHEDESISSKSTNLTVCMRDVVDEMEEENPKVHPLPCHR